MSTVPRSDMRHAFGPDHDDGLDHPHEWAREPGFGHAPMRGCGPVVADAMAIPSPSSTRHDDALYA